MSIFLTTLVWQLTTLPQTDKMLLLALADYASDDGDHIWPSQATLATKTAMTIRAVRNVTGRLERNGYLELMHYRNAHGFNRLEYKIRVDKLHQQRPVQASTPSAPATGTSCSPEEPRSGGLRNPVPVNHQVVTVRKNQDRRTTEATTAIGIAARQRLHTQPPGMDQRGSSPLFQPTTNRSRVSSGGRSDRNKHGHFRGCQITAIEACRDLYVRLWTRHYGQVDMGAPIFEQVESVAPPKFESRDYGVLRSLLTKFQGRAGVMSALVEFFHGEGCQTYESDPWRQHDLRGLLVEAKNSVVNKLSIL